MTTNDDVLNYNAMQLSVQRRLTKGLQMGLAYTLSKSEGVKGWDFMTEELGGKQAICATATTDRPRRSQEQDRRHMPRHQLQLRDSEPDPEHGRAQARAAPTGKRPASSSTSPATRWIRAAARTSRASATPTRR